jgi:hypothetical protein
VRSEKDAEIGGLRIENEELRALAFGEIEYFEALAARWSRHLQPVERRQPCRTR